MATEESSDIEWWDFEPLTGVFELRSDGILAAVVLQFGQRSVQFAAVPEDDTLTVCEIKALPEAESDDEVRAAIDERPWNGFLGSSVRWGRRMTNHHGYIDGYQLEFGGSGSAPIGDGIEMVVAATSIQLGTSHFGV